MGMHSLLLVEHVQRTGYLLKIVLEGTHKQAKRLLNIRLDGIRVTLQKNGRNEEGDDKNWTLPFATLCFFAKTAR